MRAWAGGVFALAVLAIALPELAGGLRPLGWITVAIGLPLACLFFLRIPGWIHTLALAGLVAGVGLGQTAGISGWWAAFSLPLGVLAWDLVYTARQLERFAWSDRRRFAVHYLSRAALYAGAGFGLIGLALQARWAMGFGPAILLSLGAVVSSILIIRQLWPRPKTRQREAPSPPRADSRDGRRNDRSNR